MTRWESRPLSGRWKSKGFRAEVGWGRPVGYDDDTFPEEAIAARVWWQDREPFLELRYDTLLTDDGADLAIRHLEREPDRKVRKKTVERLLAAVELVGEVVERAKTGPKGPKPIPLDRVRQEVVDARTRRVKEPFIKGWLADLSGIPRSTFYRGIERGTIPWPPPDDWR